MAADQKSLLLTDLTPAQVRDALERDRRLIVPVGACDQYGPHLPIGTCTLIAETFARNLSDDCGVLVAPTIQYGVNVPTRISYPGVTTLREKTLHAFLNDLLSCWEDEGFDEFVLITVHDYDSHVEAIATVTGTSSRVRVVEVLNMDLTEILSEDTSGQHGGEVVTSLMLHLYPDRVSMEHAIDFVAGDHTSSNFRRVPAIPITSPGSIGQPSRASAETGRRLYEHMYGKIRSRVFLSADE